MKRATPQGTFVIANTAISIHALVKRATKKLVGDLDYKIISIHALVKRATTKRNLKKKTISFQSTPS